MNSSPLLTRSGLCATVVTASVVASLSLLDSSAIAGQTYYVPISKKWSVTGHGYGHGHGMSQYGAQGAALQGLNYRQIVDFYYPRTRWATAKGSVRVLISDDYTSDLQVRTRPGLEVRDLADHTAWTLPANDGVDRWRLAARGGATVVQFHDRSGWHRWRVPGRGRFAGAGEFLARGPLTLLLPDGGDSVTPRKYRGTLRSVPPYAGATTRDTVNVLSMDAYVQGVVPYEMPASWKPAALRAQAVAARTYAAWQRAQNPRRYYQICDTTACQVYGGVPAEQSSSNKAVQVTAGKILTYHGRPAFTQFSSSSGGWTSSGGVPYLPAQADPYDAFDDNPMHTWKVTVDVSALERAHPEVGRLVDLRVSSRDGHGSWGGRVQQIVLRGSDGTAYLTGDDFRWQYGLRSTWFAIAPTPIIERWRHIGAAKSSVGRPRSGEYGLVDGSAQKFAHGRIFWSRASGAREMLGPVLRAYRKLGGPSSTLGWPETGVLRAALGGHKVRLQGGYLFAKPKIGAHALFGPILRYWWRHEGGPRGQLGYPTRNVVAVRVGQRATFQGGRITYVRATHEFRVVINNAG